MLTCSQCNEAVEGIDTKAYAVGWCGRDVHLACFALHLRSCQACRLHNQTVAANPDPPEKEPLIL